MLMIYFYVFVSFFLILIFHELGHYFLAKKFNVKIDLMVIGYGPVLFQNNFLKIKLFPINAYTKVNMESLKKSSKTTKIFVALGGILSNLFIGILVVLFCFLFFKKNLFQEKVFLREGVHTYQIKKVFNKKVDNYYELLKMLNFYLMKKNTNKIIFQVKDKNSASKTILIPSELIRIALLGIQNNNISFYQKNRIKKENNSFIYHFFAFGIISIILALFNLLPLAIGEIKSDGYLFFKFLLEKKKGD